MNKIIIRNLFLVFVIRGIIFLPFMSLVILLMTNYKEIIHSYIPRVKFTQILFWVTLFLIANTVAKVFFNYFFQEEVMTPKPNPLGIGMRSSPFRKFLNMPFIISFRKFSIYFYTILTPFAIIVIKSAFESKSVPGCLYLTAKTIYGSDILKVYFILLCIGLIPFFNNYLFLIEFELKKSKLFLKNLKNK